MDNLIKDDRFAHIIKDPKFRRIPKNERKVKIDKRFQSMFEDNKFSVSFTVDKRGKPSIQRSGENLRKFYNASDSEDYISPDTDSDEPRKLLKQAKTKNRNGKNNKLVADKKLLIKSSEEKENQRTLESELFKLKDNEKQLCLTKKNECIKISENIKEKLRNLSVDYARGEGLLLSDSSSDQESLYFSDSNEKISHNWGEFDKEAEETVTITHRLAACNMDWDNMRAVDLMVSLHSFLPSGGQINSVTIYPSEFGLQRMKEEEISGPTELVNDCSNELDEENEEGSSYHMEKLRQYQLNRLKYYYAVIVCDSPETADKLWNECRNVEYESSGIKYDLRFIPDDMDFDQTSKEVCDKLPDFSTYQPRIFTTTALQQEKVDLTWDETNVERLEITRKINSGKLVELNENHIHALLASGTSEDESDFDTKENKVDSDIKVKGNTIQKYKLLLKSIDEKEKAKNEKDVELECTWGFNVKEENKELKQDKQKSEILTPFEEYLERRKEKRKSRIEEKVTHSDETSRSEDSISSDIDISDPFFADELKTCTLRRKKSRKTDKNKILSTSNGDEQNDELELILMDRNEYESKQHFNMKEIEEKESFTKSKTKRLKRKNKDSLAPQNDNFEINVQDPRFDALFTSHHFNIDPADSHFRKTKGTKALVNEKLKRRNKEVIKTEANPKQQRNEKDINPEIVALLKSAKRIKKINK